MSESDVVRKPSSNPDSLFDKLFPTEIVVGEAELDNSIVNPFEDPDGLVSCAPNDVIVIPSIIPAAFCP